MSPKWRVAILQCTRRAVKRGTIVRITAGGDGGDRGRSQPTKIVSIDLDQSDVVTGDDVEQSTRQSRHHTNLPKNNAEI
ncbi:MAG TPA: hypothetical protein DGG94_07840 [Micromonosporaceae bacterium]|nr:hypothetical protein [Micromonosporaceae bacterium]HCU49698.1 hypothetical protein [Micromonosporaceae bacterium]